MKRNGGTMTLILLASLISAPACQKSGSSGPPPSGPTSQQAPSATLPSPSPNTHSHPADPAPPHAIPATPPLAEQVESAARSLDPDEVDRGDTPVAVVGDETITVRDLELRLQEMHGGIEQLRRSDFDLDQLIFRMVNDLLIAQEARVLEMHLEEPTRGQVERFRREEALRELERREIFARAKVTEEEVLELFGRRYMRVDLRVVTVDTRQEADSILEEVQTGADMAAFARERSHDPYAARGGRAAGLPLRDLAPEIAALTSTLQIGDVGGPVRTDLGWSVVRLEGFAEADPKELEEARPILRNLITLERVKARRAEVARRAAEKHAVIIDERVVDAIVPERLTDGRLSPTIADRHAVVARVGDTVTLIAGEYADALMLRWSGVRNEEAARAAAPIILSNLIDTVLLLAESQDLGYAGRPEVLQRTRSFETQLLVQRYLSEVVEQQIPVSREEMLAHYETHQDAFRKPPRLSIGQITVETGDEAEEVADLLRRGTDLSWLARQRSIDRFASSGGDRGWIEGSPGNDELSRALGKAAQGAVIGPIGGPGNYVVIKVTAREEQGHYEFREVSGNVRNAVVSKKSLELIDGLVKKLRSRASIEVDEEAIASLRVSGTRDESQDTDSGTHVEAH